MPERSHKGLVLRDVKVKRGGKTFTQKRWVKAGDDELEPKKGKKIDLISQLKIGDIVNVGGKLSKVKSINEKGRVVILHNDVLGDEVYDFDKLNKIGKLETPEGRFKPNKPIKFMNKDLIIKKVSESEKTVKLSDGKVYTFNAIDKGSEIKEEKKPKIKDIKQVKPKSIKPKLINISDTKKDMKLHINELNKTSEGKELLDRIESYTGGAYKSFNEYLRTGKMSLRDHQGKIKVGKPPKAKKEEQDKNIEKISDFIKDAPKISGTVYRGMVWSKDKKSIKEFNDFMNDINNNNHIEFPNFSSTSTSKETAMDFATSQKGVESVVIEMKSKNGIYLNGASAFSNEDEVLFDKSSNFKVIKVDQESKPIRIYLEEI